MSDESAISILLNHDQPHRMYYLVLLEIGVRVRAAMPQFDVGHLALLADELDVDLLDYQIRPHDLEPTTEGIGLIAATIWGEPASERWKWKHKLNDASLLDPSTADRDLLLARVLELRFVQTARWADDR